MRPSVSAHALRLLSCALLASVLLALALLLPHAAQAGHGHKAADKRGILLVAFGTSVPEAVQAIDALKAEAEAAFPGVPVRLAYSSKIIRDKVARQGIVRPSPAQALADMAAEGFTQVAVQSLHAIPGREFSDITATAEAFQAMPKGIAHVSVGRPLLHSHEDIAKAAEVILAALPRHKKDEAVLLMGHGTDHPANAAYAALQLALWKRDKSVFIATVEGTPGLDEVLPELKRRGVRLAHLVPLMSVAGDHAMNDMAGADADSWASRLRAAGIASRAEMLGLGSRPAVAALWIDHLRDAVKQLPATRKAD
ncbi:MAG: sirohydrochlorin cobaltochelatase [Humidesulfovibrio sp.]|uniref:sirohydrochlorin cobaltochelatase n=1 Tax=Humidesulfovibrio sp. TaxID=2910988 RepID=UPI0027F6D424|nr:sirohydrochlorin cobaltochelatase [Humidesulfovibrio sp.]MDQ7834653.1 sirohydrochlorin cobaltochelatase [Humidesulfovibrio sp.]